MVLVLPSLDLGQPFVLSLNHPTGSERPNKGHKSVQTSDDISKDWDLSPDNLVYILGQSLKANDTATTRNCSGSCSRGEGVNLSRHAVIEVGTEGDDGIGILNS
jgi:hypothetical protein